MTRFACPFLHGEVELGVERNRHIRLKHPELPEDLSVSLASVLADPDEVRVDQRFPQTYLFSRWLDDLLGVRYW